MEPAAFEADLARRLPEALARTLLAPAVTSIVAGTEDAARVARALAVLREALLRRGIAGRTFVLVASPDGGVAPPGVLARYRDAARLPVIAHDPVRSPCFALGLGPGSPALDDELREAEAVILLGAVGATGGGERWVWPGLAARAAWDGPAHGAREVCERLGVDLAVVWQEGAGEPDPELGAGLEAIDRVRARLQEAAGRDLDPPETGP